MPDRERGRVMTWDDARGFGFIKPTGDYRGATVFVHRTALDQTGQPLTWPTFRLGELLEYQPIQTSRGVAAKNVRRVAAGEDATVPHPSPSTDL